MKGPITTHVLDLVSGSPAAGIPAKLEFEAHLGEWHAAGIGTTDADGRIENLLQAGHPLRTGAYRLSFELARYHQEAGREAFHPRVTIDFVVRDTDQHYHVPLLLSPFGYSTYRGS
jgi:5-hydroxyisourate hydrolase